MNILPTLLCDGYKIGHKFQYEPNTTLIYSNLTPRKSRVEEVEKVVAFGMQYLTIEYLVNQFNLNFFGRKKSDVLRIYQRRIDNYLGPGINFDHIAALHDLQYLPLHIKAVPEGTLVPFRVPILTIRNTKPEFFWLTNMLETLISNILWMPCTSATTAFRYRKAFEKYAKETGAPKAFVPWQGHDFSFRGMAGVEAACLSGAAHLLSFTGTDTIPAIDLLEQYYGANCEEELIGGSVPATEHSVMSMGMQGGEYETFKRLITQVYPKGIVSIVSDTWDFWQVLVEYLPRLRADILGREGKVVIRPDSGDPVKIICGDPNSEVKAIHEGAIATLHSVFGGLVNKAGYIELDPHIGLIYGDSITPERQVEILERLKARGFASSNVVLGIGSYTYQHVTRDTYGWAIKATYGERYAQPEGREVLKSDQDCSHLKRTVVGQNIFKKPATDDGTKDSAKGLLCLNQDMKLVEGCTWNEEEVGILQTIFLDGGIENFQSLKQIRARLEAQL